MDIGGAKIGVQIHPQHTTAEDLRRAWRSADAAGADSIWVWDHFFPLYGGRDGTHFECWTQLAAMAVETSRARIGSLVTCAAYRNPDLLADMARTVDHLSGGRLVLGIGVGWAQRDYEEYGYAYGRPATRLRELDRALGRIERRLRRLNPPAFGSLPILIGGGGERVTLRLVARHAQIWNLVSNDPDSFAAKQRVLDDWCRREGRRPGDVERTVCFEIEQVPDPAGFVEAGAQHLIVQWRHPFPIEPVRHLLTRFRGPS
jgi:probable F420-dependent oxidoreductase